MLAPLLVVGVASVCVGDGRRQCRFVLVGAVVDVVVGVVVVVAGHVGAVVVVMGA